MAELNNIINVALLPEGTLALRDNVNNVCIFTTEAPLSTTERYRVYRSIKGVGEDFGTHTKTYEFAQTFFAQTPNAVDAGGSLIIGFWAEQASTVPVSAATLTGGEIDNKTEFFNQLNAIDDGSFQVTVDNNLVSKTGVDFKESGVISIDGVLTKLNDGLSNLFTASFVNNRFVLTSNTTGDASSITKLSAITDGGTFLGTILKLTDGAKVVNGADESIVAAESKEAAVNTVHSQAGFSGYCFISPTTSTEAKALSDWSQANSVLGYDVFGASAFVIGSSSVAWNIKSASNITYRMLGSKSGNRKLAAAYMSRSHTANFNADTSALSMNLKELATIEPEDYSETELTIANTIGIDVYTTFKNVPAVRASSGNDFQDNVYNLIAYVNAIQTDLFNVLKISPTKIPQTIQGVNQLLDQANNTSRQFVRAGVFAPGTWSNPTTFGDKDTFKHNIEQNRVYWIAGSLANQPQQDRADRKSPVLQGAVKNSSSIHLADIIINFNK